MMCAKHMTDHSRCVHPAFSGVASTGPRARLPEALASGMARYDNVVIGAGAAGCALVDRLLTGIPDVSILLLEAGPGNDVPQIRNFTQAMSLRGTRYDWNDYSLPQTCMKKQEMPYDSGCVNGGGSSINSMVWVRGNAGDYDSWEAGADWHCHELLPVFQRQETYGGSGGGPTRGTSGPVYTTNQIAINPVSNDFISAMVASGYTFN